MQQDRPYGIAGIIVRKLMDNNADAYVNGDNPLSHTRDCRTCKYYKADRQIHCRNNSCDRSKSEYTPRTTKETNGDKE